MKKETSLIHPKYRPDIDGLRAVAVLAVVAFHAFPGRLPGGFIGVDVFFVISGFLISTIVFENLNQDTFSFKEFYARRIRRIFPALVTTLLGVLILGLFVLIPADELNQLGKHMAASAGFITNFVLASEAGYFDTAVEQKPLLHLWSLGIEEQFYIFWPIFLWFAWKHRANLLILMVIITLISFFFNISRIGTNPVETFYFPQTRFWELLSGGLLSWIKFHRLDSCRNFGLKLDQLLKRFVYREYRVADGGTLLNILSFFGIGLLIFGFTSFNKNMFYPGWWALIPVLGSIAIILAGSSAWINKVILSQKTLVWFGLISFSLYLWHWPLISFLWIIEGKQPSLPDRISAILLAVVLAWLTTALIEKPFRYGHRVKAKIISLCTIAILIGLVGLVLSSIDFSKTNRFNHPIIKRAGFEYIIGSSLNWYEGKDNWLFLGNNHSESVAKLRLAKIPDQNTITATKEIFSKVAVTAAKYGTELVLIVGPNKENVYPEYLPNEAQPGVKKYSSAFVDELQKIPNLTVYDPTSDLVSSKESQGLLYWKTDSHWNNKGAFISFQGFLKAFSIPIPKVNFQRGEKYSGDLIKISKLIGYPLDSQDNWKTVWKDRSSWSSNYIKSDDTALFGQIEKVINMRPVSNKTIWVTGDSFSDGMREFFNGTFKEVIHLSNLNEKLGQLSSYLDSAQKKPDMVIIVRVERSF
jgi:peptidoglycan/LPS O-acetylase OafA/YrhL